MNNERGGILRRLLLLGLLGWGGWILYTRWWPPHNLERFGGHLEHDINKELLRAGVTDRDVLSQVSIEHRQWGLTWVETRREILADSAHAAGVTEALEDAAHRQYCFYDQKETSKGLDVRITFLLWPLQRLLLVKTAPLPVHAQHDHLNGPAVAFVIDDVAYETAPMDRFASLGVPLTFAILPREKHSSELSRKATALHFPVMLHLPMEPLDVAHNDPGPSGLYLKMSPQELKFQFDRDVASVPNIVGINNHMGSAFTENDPKMALVLEWVKMKKLYFLDSHTTGKSVVSKVAKRVGVPCLINDTFLDNKDDVPSIEKELDRVMALAVKHGRTIAIGHYRRKYLVEALAAKLPEFKDKGIQIVPLPTFYHR